MKIVKLDIDENSILAGIDAVALVEQPAIEEDFYYFGEQKFAETYTDYPQAAVDAAKQGIKRNEALGNPCATQVGKVRAQQLANREPVSLDTVRRMRAFLIRQKDNYELQRDRKAYDECGYISYLLWGGPAALPWAEKILRQAGEEFVKDEYQDLEDACQPGYIAYGLKRKNGRLVPNCVPKQNFEALLVEDLIKNELFAKVYDTEEEALIAAGMVGCEGAHQMPDGKWMPCEEHREMEIDVTALPDYVAEVTSSLEYSFSALDEQQMLIGPLMTPNKLIPRLDDNGDKYYVYFTEDTIKKLSYKMMKDKLIDSVNIEHNSSDKVSDAYMVESWLVEDPYTDKSNKYGFEPVKGQWFGIYKIDNKEIWDDYIKSGKVKGFSIEGFFENHMMSKTQCRKNGQCACGKTSNAMGLCDGSHLNK